MKNLLSFVLILVLLSVGCKKEKGDPPVLPPAESMSIDFSNFNYQGKSATLPAAKGAENSSWEFAALAAGTWNLILGTTLFVPVMTFHLATDQAPSFVSENLWQWSYSSTIANVVYNARLTGEIKGSSVEWKMYVTKEGSFTDFLWFQGTSQADGSSGYWILNESNTSPTQLLRIDWEKSGATVGKIKYTFVKNTEFKDSFIEYGLTTAALNAFYKIHYYDFIQEKFIDVDVEWSTSGHNGKIRSSGYLDGIWHCWDSNKVNTECQ